MSHLCIYNHYYLLLVFSSALHFLQSALIKGRNKNTKLIMKQLLYY